LLGPDSVSRRINQEIVVLAGWSPAVLLQLAHPLVLQGVLDHSVFVAAPHRRLERAHSTVESFLMLAFGTAQEILSTAAKINGIHDRVHGRLPHQAGSLPRGTCYDAHDPELLRWVHATLIDVLPRAYELFVGPLTARERDQYYAEAATVGPLLGMAEDFLPRTGTELREYLQRMYAGGQIAITDDARWLAREILRPLRGKPALERAFGPLLPALYWLNGLPTIGLLPPPIRRAYGFSWTPLQSATLGASAWLTRRLLPLVPSVVRHWPASRRGGA